MRAAPDMRVSDEPYTMPGSQEANSMHGSTYYLYI